MQISFDAVGLTGVVLVNVVFGLTILLRNAKSRINILYGVMVFVVTSWAVANYFSNHVGAYNAELFVNRLSFITGFLLVLSVWLLSAYFPQKAPHFGRQVPAATATTIILSILCFTPVIISGVHYDHARQVIDIQAGSAYFLYVVGILTILIFVVTNFVRAYRRSTGLARAQVSYSGIAILLTAAWILLTSAVIPAITGNWAISKLGNMGTVFLIAITGYTIVRHKLFDIKLVVARSLAYTLSLLTLGVLFVASTYALTSLFFSQSNAVTGAVRLTYTLLAILLAFILPSLRRFFDRATNRIFYRDAYDSQTLLDQFNKVLVSTFGFTPLLKQSASVIEATIKPTFCLFGIKETQHKRSRIIGTAHHPSFTEEDIAAVRRLTPQLRQKVIATDSLGDQHDDLRKLLQANGIAVLVRLVGVVNEEGIGYLVLGPKKSGNLYSAQDIKVIEIIANELVIAIQNALHTEEIENFNLTLQERVNSATRKLRNTNEKLKALDEAKDDFVSMASHQLRTPLTSIKGYTSMVLEGDAGKINATQRKLLEQSFVSSQRMVYLIADLLNVSRLKTGKFTIEPAPVNLAEVVQQEIGQLTETAAARQLTLIYTQPDSFPTLMLDETKTRQVIMNFVDNAIYYTPAGGHIEVKLVETPASVELRVIDDGIGVPKSEQPHLFTKFYRAGNARKARPDGTGLGLFMAKKIIVAEGGAIIFQTEEGKGSTFGFMFSKSKMANTPDNQAIPAKETTSANG